MEHSVEFRRCLEECDVPAARKLWQHIAPHLPQPANDLEAMATIHRARTEMPSMHIRLRAYSHRWLIDNGYPSALPDDLKPKAERMYPRIVDGVGIAAKAASELMRPAIPIIRLAMSDAVNEAYADGRTDPVYVKARIMEARRLCIKRLFAITVPVVRACLFLLVPLIGITTAATAQQKIDGACGSANGVATNSAPTNGLCSAGTASVVTSTGSGWTWTCRGIRGGRTASCSAPLAAPPPPRLTLTVTPASPSISSNSPAGTSAATVTAAWSNGAPFTGTLSFGSPYLDDGGTFALANGNQVIVSPLGMGVSGDAGTTQLVTVVATQ